MIYFCNSFMCLTNKFTWNKELVNYFWELVAQQKALTKSINVKTRSSLWCFLAGHYYELFRLWLKFQWSCLLICTIWKFSTKLAAHFIPLVVKSVRYHGEIKWFIVDQRMRIHTSFHICSQFWSKRKCKKQDAISLLFDLTRHNKDAII